MIYIDSYWVADARPYARHTIGMLPCNQQGYPIWLYKSKYMDFKLGLNHLIFRTPKYSKCLNCVHHKLIAILHQKLCLNSVQSVGIKFN